MLSDSQWSQQLDAQVLVLTAGGLSIQDTSIVHTSTLICLAVSTHIWTLFRFIAGGGPLPAVAL